MDKIIKEPKVTSKTKQQLANEYNVHVSTFSNWLRSHPEIPEPGGYIYSPLIVEKIYEVFGRP